MWRLSFSPRDLHLQPLQRRIDIARGAAGRALLAHHVPGFERSAQAQADAHGRDLADQREAELQVRLEPCVVEGITGRAQLGHDVVEVHLHEGRQQEAVVQPRAPACQTRRAMAAVGLAPEPGQQRAQQQLLRQAHVRMRRHLEGAQLQQAETAGGPVGRVHLVDAELAAMGVAGDVDQQVAQAAVHHPRRHLLVHRQLALQLGKGDLDLVDLVVARLVDARRLAGRADEHAAEQVAQDGWLCQ